MFYYLTKILENGNDDNKNGSNGNDDKGNGNDGTTMLGMTAVETVIKGADRQIAEDRTDIIFRCIKRHMIRSHLI